MKYILCILLLCLAGCVAKRIILPCKALSPLVDITQSQRSSIKVITVTFSEPVTVSGDALWIMDQSYQAINLPNVVFRYEGITATWTFSESLPDGRYIATFKAEKIVDIAGNCLDGDKNGVGGDNYEIYFSRLYGDTTGDGQVDRDDLVIMVTRWLKSPEDTGLDFNGDGKINHIDMAGFSKNWKRKL